MVKNITFLAAAIILAGCVSVKNTEKSTGQKPDGCPLKCAKKPAQILRHIVLFKFKDGTTNEQIKKFESSFCSLPSKIDAIYDYEWGTDVSVENRSQGFTHCFIVTFLAEADRDKYLPHPAHKELVAILEPHLDKVIVIDYWTK